MLGTAWVLFGLGAGAGYHYDDNKKRSSVADELKPKATAADQIKGVDAPGNSTDATSRRLQSGPNCPAGMYDATGGSAHYWACGNGCAGGLYTDGTCGCACQCTSGTPADLRGSDGPCGFTALCGSELVELVPVEYSECPYNPDLATCDVVACGELCEGDGECGTNDWLNNCGANGHDVYSKYCDTPAPTPAPTTAAPTPGPTTPNPTPASTTAAPTRTRTRVEIKAAVVLTRIAADDFNSDPAAQQAFTQSILAHLPQELVDNGTEITDVVAVSIPGECDESTFPPCGSELVPVESSECPYDPALANCDVVTCGELCEGDGECGTDGNLNNCDSYDIYRKLCGSFGATSCSCEVSFTIAVQQDETTVTDGGASILAAVTSSLSSAVSTGAFLRTLVYEADVGGASATFDYVDVDVEATLSSLEAATVIVKDSSCAVCRASMMYDESDGVSCGGFTQQVKSKWGDWQWGHWEDYDGCHSTVCCADIKEDCCEANVGAIIGLIVAIFVVLAMCCYRSLIKDSILRVWRRCCPKHKVHPAIAATQNSRDTLPPYWNPIMNRLNAERFPVDPGSEEYARVETAFMLTLFDPTRGLHRNQFTIQSVERIQNMDLWNLYVAKRKSVCGRKSPKDAQNLVRNWLFHGCSGDVTDEIAQGGFNRSFVGRHATAYGKGIYFARDASYSTYPLYSQRDANGVQSIFLARVVVGEYCLGVQDALVPAMRDATTHAHYDSTVDNLQNPNIFVTYNDAQAYPEYLIKFKQDGTPPSHPTIGKPAPPDYRPNVFSSCYD
jgi:poly [ADP-ribose] polymerase 10/14/15